MAIKLLGSSGAELDVDGPDSKAVDATLRPTDHEFLGSFRLEAIRQDLYMSANMGAGLPVFTFYWRDPTRLCIVTSVIFHGMHGGPIAFTPGIASFDLVVARCWTTDSAGGQQQIPMTGGYLGKGMNTTLAHFCRSAATSNLSNGTWVLDAHPVGQCMGAVGATASTTWIPRTTLYSSNATQDPLVIHHQEGLVVRGTVPATGNWRFGVTIAWTEITAY